MKLADIRTVIAGGLFLFGMAGLAGADAPSVSYIFPAGGQRGSTVTFHVGGHYLHEKCPFEMLGPGVEASPELLRAPKTVWFEGPRIPMPESQRAEDYPKDQAGRVRIAPDAPLGFRFWQVWTPQGVVPTRTFVIGHLSEIVEQEIDGDPVPTPVKPPVTINGRMFPREDVDIWTFAAKQGESFALEVLAARLGSPLDSHLEVFGPNGRRVAENSDHFGGDSFLRFTAPVDGTYAAKIHDTNFGGLQHYVYRLTITNGPYVEQVFPLGGRRGTKVAFELVGQKLPTEPVAISLPADAPPLWKHSLKTGGAETNEFAIELSDQPEQFEGEPNDTAAKATTIALPVVLNGRVSVPGDVDVWRFEAKRDQTFVFDLRAARLRSLLDGRLTICDADGKQLASADDAPGTSDPTLTFKVPADGVFTVQVTEQTASRGGRDFAYRLVITAPPSPPPPGFELRLPADALTLNRAGEAKFKITAIRQGGFDGEIDLQVGRLPQGVTVSGTKIAAKTNDIELVFKAEKLAQVRGVRLTVSGTGKLGDKLLRRTAGIAADSPDHVARDSFLLAVAQPTPFKVVGIFQSPVIACGSTFHRHFTIDRGGFKGPIFVTLADRQVRHLQGVTGGTLVVTPNESEFEYAINLPPWMEAGRTSRSCVMAVGIIEDPDGSKHKVSYTSHEQNDQIIVLTAPGRADVDTPLKSLRAEPGRAVRVPVRVGRATDLTGEATVALIVPEHVRGVSAIPVRIPPDRTTGELTVRFARGDLGPFNIPLTIRASVPDKRGNPVVGETDLVIVAE